MPGPDATAEAGSGGGKQPITGICSALVSAGGTLRGLTANTFFLTVEKSAHLLGAMLVMVAVARMLGEEVLASYVFVIGLTAFFVPILDAGFNNRVIKAVASHEGLGQGAVAEALAYKLTLAVPTVILMGVVSWASGEPYELLVAVLLVGVSTVGMSIGDAFNSALKGLQRSAYSALLIGGLNAALLLSSLVLILCGGGLVGVAMCFAVCRLGYAVAGAIVLRRVAPAEGPLGLTPVRGRQIADGLKHLASVYFLGNLLHVNYITTYVSSGEAESADFAIGYRVAAALLVLCTAGLEAVLPHVAGRFRTEGYARRSLTRTFVIYGGIGLAVALVTQVAAAPAVWLVFGGAYAGAAAPVRVLAWSVPVFVVCGLGHTILMAMDRQAGSTAVMLALFVFGALAGGGASIWQGAWATAVAPSATGCLFAVGLFSMAWRRAQPGTAHVREGG